ncbi:MAG: 2-C-methyl-D-erythritol 4-phosphate cytidylyltransferase [Lachnospiraceae bacterium]|nr:2-C-methyl-D-erythritol 4-phosphate cytidylyltransferase [Lachnospiraceae bacterium]
MKKKVSAIVLAAGSGKRMQSNTKKQFIELAGKPVLYYSLKAFEESLVDEVILVTGGDDLTYCREEIVERYHLTKVSAIVEGGKERYHSVQNGIQVAKGQRVLIHDGARPFVKVEKINQLATMDDPAAILAVPVKDTVKIVDDDFNIVDSPKRSTMYAAQTPQMFDKDLIVSAYRCMGQEDDITDDAMLVSRYTDTVVKVVQGDYTNLKITTPEDLVIAASFVR